MSPDKFDTLLLLSINIIAAASILLFITFSTNSIKARDGLLLITIIAIDFTVGATPRLLNVDLAWTRWNWIGKTLSVAWWLILLRALKIPGKKAGFTLTQKSGSVALALICCVLIIPFETIFIGANKNDFNSLLDQLAFQATMPGIAEEFGFRGVLLYLFINKNNTINDTNKKSTQEIYAVLSISTIFAFGHFFSVSNGIIYTNWPSATISGLMGIFLSWLRLRTGSLLFPILAHNTFNSTSVLLSMYLNYINYW